MTRAANLVGVGIAGNAVQYITGVVANNLTATGSSSQSGSFAVTADISVFTTAPGNSGARLPSGTNPGDIFTIANWDNNTMLIYPPTGGTCNNGSLNASVSLNTKKAADCVSIDGLNYIVMAGA